MFKHLIKFSGILLLLFLVACGGATDTAVEPAQPEQQVEDAAINEVEESNTSQGEEILPVAAKPQLVEFYADW